MKRRTASLAGADGHAGRGRAAEGMAASGAGNGRPEREDARAPSVPRFERRLGRRDLTAVGEVRAQLRALLAHWGAPGRADTAELLTSELVTNALVHTDGAAVVTATLTGDAEARSKGRLRVEVRDFVARHPALRVPGARSGGGPGDGRESGAEDGAYDIEKTATSGRGLLLVHSLADGWGVRPHGVGKAVWFELDAQEP
ncbi:ATP-binding protein [Streptomyces olivoreticuli]|uniref:ATP-binding protein n=1 Tax=Streptomyces olivoreticuli TaxID=68246 RepID=UPI000E2830AA|nr:ATP-binding protein [Streptomyces olivoreticuli]